MNDTALFLDNESLLIFKPEVTDLFLVPWPGYGNLCFFVCCNSCCVCSQGYFMAHTHRHCSKSEAVLFV